MESYYERINDIIQDLLVPVRSSKSIDKEVFEQFYCILEELREQVAGETYISRNIAGILYFISRTLSDEAEGCDYNDSLFIAAAKVEDMVDRILWNSPFK